MSPGAACGDPRAAPGCMEARGRAPTGAPGSGCKRQVAAGFIRPGPP